MTVKALEKPVEARYLLPDYFCDIENTENPEELFDYKFEGIILGVESVSQYNGNGTDIPYTYYKVKVTKEIKGDVEGEVIIKYYGGYNEEGELLLLENAELPETREKYTFYCNRTKLTYRHDERTIDGSYVISIPNCMVKGSVKTSGKRLNKQSETILVLPKVSITKYHPLAELEQMILASGDPFDRAETISLTYPFSFYLGYNAYRSFKVNRSTLDYLAIYSTGTSDVKVEVYDQEYNLIGSNDDVNTTRGLLYTSGRNFFYHFYADINKTYYFVVTMYNPNVAGTTTIRALVDNYYQSSYSNLVTSNDAVDSGKKIHYTNDTYYPKSISDGAGEWNKLGTVLILPDTSSTTNDVTISLYNDGDSGIIAHTSRHWLWGWKIQYNNYYFLNMSMAEKQKTVMHEFGHTLGFSEFCSTGYCESSDNIMVQGIKPLTRLGPADIAVNRQKWG
jgi:hypothetical protein